MKIIKTCVKDFIKKVLKVNSDDESITSSIISKLENFYQFY